MTGTTQPPQPWSTLPTAIQGLVTKRLRKDADSALAAARKHMMAAKTKVSDSSHKKEAGRARMKLQEGTALLAAWRELMRVGVEAVPVEESRLVTLG